MAEFRGTQGKWRVVEASPVDNKNICIKTDNLISVVDDRFETIAILGRKEPEQFSNAKLIASAPDLLEAALKALNECCDLIGTEAGNALEAAIKNATE